jgi:RNA polymerase sigma-70 factor (ECF subfamily)
MSDTNVIQQLISNCPRTQSTVWNKYYDSMFRVSVKITNNNEDTEDVLNESFMSLFKHIHKVNSGFISG